MNTIEKNGVPVVGARQVMAASTIVGLGAVFVVVL